jgi:hypothetical protein
MRKNNIHNISNCDGLREFYTLKDYQDFFDDDGFPRLNHEESEHVYAKCYRNKLPKSFKSNNQFRFFITVTSNNKPFNPISNSEIPEPNKFINNVCKSDIRFLEVNQIVFQKYLEFLKTKNIRWLKDLERDML